MDRKEIKELAKKKVNGNIWNLLWPVLIIAAISSISSLLLKGQGDYDMNKVSAADTIISLVISLITALITAGYTKYVLDYVRNDKFNSNTIIETIKEKWLNIIIVGILEAIIISLGFIFLIVPGIILALAYSFAEYIVVDSNENGPDVLKKSREMMKGYKLDYFVFILSFIGWIILGLCTCGLLYIWVIPYYYVANTIYYNKLKEKNK